MISVSFSSLLKGLPLLGGLLSMAYLSACLFLFIWQTRMIFLPTRQIQTTPQDLNLAYEEIWIPIAQGNRVERLHGWWIPADSSAPVLLYLHGNAANIGANVGQAYRFRQMGLSVLLVDYRGYGRSEGNFPHEEQVYQDAEAMWHYLTQVRQIAPDQILLYGHSLGGAIAIELATQHPEAAGLIVESSFTSMRAMVDRSTSLSWFPVDLLLHQRFNSIAKVPQLDLPVLWIHGSADTRTFAEMTEALYAATPHPKWLYLVPAAGHNNVAEIAGSAYLSQVRQFLHQIPTLRDHAET
jgi:uncharacterized protein